MVEGNPEPQPGAEPTGSPIAEGAPAASQPQQPPASQSAASADTPPGVEGGADAQAGGRERFAWAQMRHQNRQLQDQLQAHSRELEQAKQTLAQYQETLRTYGIIGDGANPPQTPGQSQTQPAAMSRSEVERVADEVAARRELRQAQNDAWGWMVQQAEIQSKEHLGQLKELMRRYSLDYLFEKDPLSAAELTVEAWKRERAGEGPSGNGVQTAKMMAGGLPSGSAPRQSIPAKLSPEQIRAMPMEEFNKRMDELWAASKG